MTTAAERPALDLASVFPFEATYAALPERFHARVDPTPVRAPELLDLNAPLARELGLDPEALRTPEAMAVLAGNRVPPTATPIAQAYAGHQFGNYVPQLGDGRAVLLGELIDTHGRRRDVQLKGSGITPFSRMGDGRADLFPVIGEHLASEGMAGLGIPTSRSLAIAWTGESVVRETAKPGGVLTRVAGSHLRVGTFEYFARQGDTDAVKTLADYAIGRHDPDLRDSDAPYKGLLERVTQRTADLIAQWMLVGFIHGVLNTDNIAISGETIDYGPFAWMDEYHPQRCFSQVDAWGRYAFDQQPDIGLWNLCRFAETLLPLMGDDEERAKAEVYEVLHTYMPRFEAVFHAGLRRKLGLHEAHEGDIKLAQDLLYHMAEQRADFTLTFRRLSELSRDDESGDDAVRRLFADPSAFDGWVQAWRARLAAEDSDDDTRRAAMRAVNPAYVLRKHHVYQAHRAACDGDLQPLTDLLTVLRQPYADHPELAGYSQPPAADEAVRRTFCGT